MKKVIYRLDMLTVGEVVSSPVRVERTDYDPGRLMRQSVVP